MLLLQAPLPHPELQSNISLWVVLAWAALNPAAIAVASILGRKANETPKLGIAAFAGALAGIALLWVMARLGVSIAGSAGRAAAGVFVASLPFCFLWAWLGRRNIR